MLIYPTARYSRDPFVAMRRLQEDFDRAFAPLRTGARSEAFPAINMWRGENSIAVTTELPGVEPGDIDITVKDDALTISGERKAPESGDKVAWHLRERSFGKFARTIRLPFRVDADSVEARFTNGVLQIELKRPESDLPRRIEIKSA